MSKFDEKIGDYLKHLDEIEEKHDVDLLRKVAKGCGPSIYNKDASTVSGSDPKEMETVRKNFLVKKLGLTDSDELEKGMNAVIEKYGKSRSNKYRAVVYYLLTKHYKKEAVYN
ncbi:DUF2853 family protein [Mesonia ostreae]|uniref:DUF2853 family protein n=1 Tax=Mesonia ostreae TaxID=861110 RepID=A0ABU2KK96_9FLAO|nr:DUF2853 family protein [Mesonia ostreae]MDT0295116.1 DUF2853 family protein [Mesonia ostreae]